MIDLGPRFEKARSSVLGLRVLNFLLLRGIPFNKPHGLYIKRLTKDEVQIHIPFKRSNKNHIGGLHACVLATAAEYSTGLLLLQHLGTAEYRLIMQNLTVDYYYQGKTDGVVNYQLNAKDLMEDILRQLKNSDSASTICEVDVLDTKSNKLCTAKVMWQIKPWSKVRTKTTN